MKSISPSSLRLAAAAILAGSLTGAAQAGVLDKQKLLESQTWWDNRDFDWFKANIPFFECPDPELTTTYYYRWELITKHITYGSPNSGYSFTEFIDRPFWSGAYGAISCPVGHQMYELRWLNDPTYVRDYSRYWFRTENAQPRNYGCWLADGIWSTQLVHPDNAFMVDLLPDLKKNHAGWEKRQYVAESGMFWQNGHDDGMEFNINSRQTTNILRGADGFRPGFNAYMWADALAIAQTAKLAGDEATVKEFEAKAAGIKENVQKQLWDPERQFFFPMAFRDEKDKEGNIVMKKGTLTYRSGQFDGNPHGRELHGYIPWQFNMVDKGKGFETAWKFLMDKEYFFAEYGPTTVERNDPQFVLKDGCCWWSGQSWPYATAQTLKAMANLLQNYDQKFVSKADYVKLLQIFSNSHRKDGKPYLAEALNPFTGSFKGHDGDNHSNHYFHSSFNDLVITGLVGLKPSASDTLEIDPLAPAEWPYFALDDVSYHGHKLSVLWDKDGTRYGKGAGFRVLANGKEVASSKTLGKLSVKLPAATLTSVTAAKTKRMNYAVNNDGDYYPRISTSYTNPKFGLSKINDGNYWYTVIPTNRWTTEGTPNKSDWLEVDLGTPRKVDTFKLFFLDDEKGVMAPASYEVEYFDGKAWAPIPGQKRSPAKPTGHLPNTVTFAPRDITKIRAVFTHAAGGFTGMTEVEVWGEGTIPYTPAPPKAGNLAYNQAGKGFPEASASFSDTFGGKPQKATDGRIIYMSNPMNRWTSFGSPNPTDWIAVDFGSPKEVGRAELYIFDDRGGVKAPASYTVQYHNGTDWVEVPNQKKSPEKPTGGTLNTVTFPKISTQKIRVEFTHDGKARSGLTELEFWKE